MEFTLTNNWTIILDGVYSVFVDTKKPDTFAVINSGYGVLEFIIETAADTVDITNHAVSTRYKINTSNRTISFHPESDD